MNSINHFVLGYKRSVSRLSKLATTKAGKSSISFFFLFYFLQFFLGMPFVRWLCEKQHVYSVCVCTVRWTSLQNMDFPLVNGAIATRGSSVGNSTKHRRFNKRSKIYVMPNSFRPYVRDNKNVNNISVGRKWKLPKKTTFHIAQNATFLSDQLVAWNFTLSTSEKQKTKKKTPKEWAKKKLDDGKISLLFSRVFRRCYQGEMAWHWGWTYTAWDIKLHKLVTHKLVRIIKRPIEKRNK